MHIRYNSKISTLHYKWIRRWQCGLAKMANIFRSTHLFAFQQSGFFIGLWFILYLQIANDKLKKWKNYKIEIKWAWRISTDLFLWIDFALLPKLWIIKKSESKFNVKFWLFLHSYFSLKTLTQRFVLIYEVGRILRK